MTPCMGDSEDSLEAFVAANEPRIEDDLYNSSKSLMGQTISQWSERVHALNIQKGFHDNPSLPSATSINPSGRTVWTMLGNIMCEVAEAWEVVREGTFDPNVHIAFETDKYGNAKPEGVGPELADIFIRTMDTAQALGIDREKMVAIKHQYNLGRTSKHGGKRV